MGRGDPKHSHKTRMRKAWRKKKERERRKRKNVAKAVIKETKKPKKVKD